MSTRSTIYYSYSPPEDPEIHIYTEMLDEAPNNIHLEIIIPHCLINICIPLDLQGRLGIKP
jgi:hypothetical protein